MTTRALEAIVRPGIADFRGDSGQSISSASVSSSTGAHIVGPESMSLLFDPLACTDLMRLLFGTRRDLSKTST